MFTRGKVKRIDRKAGEVTISHGLVVNLDMPGMTMVFKADEATIDTLSEGDTIEFIAHEVDGEITLTDVK